MPNKKIRGRLDSLKTRAFLENSSRRRLQGG